MEFAQFLNFVPKIVESELLGQISHLKMAPSERKKMMENYDSEVTNSRKASVLILIYPKNDIAHLVLIIRNKYDGVHSSQIAFPGGKPELSDDSFETTALRETFEEIGVESEKIKLIRSFTEIYIPPSNFLVYPFLGYSSENLKFIPDPNEVAGIIEWPISALLDNSNCILRDMTTSYSDNIEVPVYQANNHFVWGATAMVLSELKDVFDSLIFKFTSS